jgi:probable DNA metabolism protein
MYQRADVIYRYDGTWEGLMNVVFESFTRKEEPSAIVPWDEEQLFLLPVRTLQTDPEKAGRVDGWIRAGLSPRVHRFLSLAYLSALPEKELWILRFLQKARREGPGMVDHLTDETVDALTKAVMHLEHEAHLLTGFIRFSVYGSIMAAQIGPKNRVLPLLAEHFTRRFSREAFLIHDQTHGMALVYRPYEWAIVPMEDFELAPPDSEEAHYRALWRQFYDAVAIPGRLNPRCRMSHMPRRYWKYMTEFQRETNGEEMKLRP